MSKLKLVDSSVLIAFFNSNDSQHQKARSVIEEAIKETTPLLIHEYVLLETVTILKRYLNEEDLASCIDVMKSEPYVLQESTYSLFENEKLCSLFTSEHKLSMVDTTLLFMALEEEIELVTFDEWLEKRYKESIFK